MVQHVPLPDHEAMAEDTTTTSSERPAAADRPRRLHRSRRDKVVAGVAGGLGEYLNIDPVIIRIGFVALAIAGGSGVLLYALGWLFLPEEGRDEAPGGAAFHSLFHRRPIVAIILVIIGVSMLLDDFGWDHDNRGDVGWPLALVAIGAVILFSQRRGGRAGTGGGGDDTLPPQPSPSASDTTEPRDPIDDVTEVEELAEARAAGAGTAADFWPPPTGTGTATARADIERPRPFLTPVTISLLLIGGGVAALLDMSLQAYLAGALLLVGAVLLVGSRVGQARGLIVVGLVLAATATFASVADLSLAGGVGDRIREPETLAELEGEYRLGIGEMTLDLSDIDFTSSREVSARIGVGELKVRVPDDVHVVVDAEVGVGEAHLFGVEEGGIGVERTARSRASTGGETARTLELQLRAGIGRIFVEVDRAAA